MRPGFIVSVEISKKKKKKRQSWGSKLPGTPQIPVDLAGSKSVLLSSLHALAGIPRIEQVWKVSLYNQCLFFP